MSKNTSFENFILNATESGEHKSVSKPEQEEKKMENLKEALELGENSGIAEKFNPKEHLRSLHKRHL